MHPNHEHLLVVRPVEDADLAARGEPLRVSPQEVVVELLGRGDLEAVDDRRPAGSRRSSRVGSCRPCRPRRAPAARRARRRCPGRPGAPGTRRGSSTPMVRSSAPSFLSTRPSLGRGIEVLGEVHAAPRLDQERLDELGDAGAAVVRHRRAALVRDPCLRTAGMRRPISAPQCRATNRRAGGRHEVLGRVPARPPPDATTRS